MAKELSLRVDRFWPVMIQPCADPASISGADAARDKMFLSLFSLCLCLGEGSQLGLVTPLLGIVCLPFHVL